jgi:hypothetical protein
MLGTKKSKKYALSVFIAEGDILVAVVYCAENCDYPPPKLKTYLYLHPLGYSYFVFLMPAEHKHKQKRHTVVTTH